MGSVNESFRRAYVGKDYDKINNKMFSLDFLIFSVVHFFYKKMYIIGFAYLLIFLGVVGYNNFFIYLLFIGSTVMMSFLFNDIYLKNVDYKINKIINKYPLWPDEQIMAVCEKQGGSSLTAMGISLVFLVAGSIFIIVLSSNLVGFFFSVSDNVDTLSYTLPRGFVKSKYKSGNSYLKSYIYDYSVGNSKCSITIDSINREKYEKKNEDSYYFDNISDFVSFSTDLYENANNFSAKNDMKLEKLNGGDWYTYHYNKDTDNNYYLVYSSKYGYSYAIEYSVLQDPKHSCELLVDKFKNSLSVNK